MTHRPILLLFLLLLLAGLLPGTPPVAWAQTPGTSGSSDHEPIAQLSARAGDALDSARKENLDLLAPHHFGRAQAAYDEARTLIERKREEELIHIKLKLTLDEVDAARRTATDSRKRLGEVLAARTAAQAAGSDTLSGNLWKRTEDRFRGLLRDVERDPAAADSQSVNEMAGAYRAARRDALRSWILKDARERVDAVERRGGTRTVPSLVLRAQQAISRAEADLAQENLDGARDEAQVAIRTSAHALALMNYIASCQKAKQPWESALLPYDDILTEVATRLGDTLDLSRGGAATGPQIFAFITARQESLVTQVAHQAQTLKSLEGSLAEAQTNLADAQGRISELERRLQAAEGERSSARQTLQKSGETTDRIARAQDLFKPGEAVILQNADATVTIRLTGLKYGSGATNLDPARQKVMDRAIQAIGQFPGAEIRVEGHTDSVGRDDDNQKLLRIPGQGGGRLSCPEIEN